jgi:flavodoxin
MKIGIIVHSKTGNTLSVAERLKKELEGAGHSVKIDRIETESDGSDPKNPVVKLTDPPDASKYDVILFGSPVWAFSLSTVMKAYLSQLQSIKGKKVGCFVTQQLPFKWMGGNRAIKQMSEASKAKGGSVSETGIVNWSSKKRESMLLELTGKMKRLV